MANIPPILNGAEVRSNTLLKADEVDAVGTLVANPDPQNKPVASITTPAILDSVELQEAAVNGLKRKNVAPPPARPTLRRGERSTPPPQLPPPPAPPQSSEDFELPPMDPITLAQLRQLIEEVPRSEPAPYDFEYDDFSSFTEEVEEFIGYRDDERDKLHGAQTAFSRRWIIFLSADKSSNEVEREGNMTWCAAGVETQRRFLEVMKKGLIDGDKSTRSVSLVCVLYLALGCWKDIYDNKEANDPRESPNAGEDDPKSQNAFQDNSAMHLDSIKRNTQFIMEVIGPQVIFDQARAVCLPSMPERKDDSFSEEQPTPHADGGRKESWASIAILYLLIEVSLRASQNGNDTLRQSLLKVEPSVLNGFTNWLAESRWDDTSGVPSSKLLLLYWKSILLTFGGLKKIEEIKHVLTEPQTNGFPNDDPYRITASPLDYHMFRQEIISKYPAFDPPQPLFPFEPEQTSVLPSLQDYDRLDDDMQRLPGAGSTTIGRNSASILHQPVHIATPAPSPPPSPAGPGGKGIKKQNYQTNQMFPFLYPPLEESSNDLGGKGSTALQDLLVGRKWYGSDIPASILEAANLFAQRMRATRAMKQLWEERLRFMKYERGYGKSNLDIKTSNIRANTTDVREAELPVDLNADLQGRLDAVEAFYQYTLPKMQSVMVVLLKVLIRTATTLATQPTQTNGSPHGHSNAQQSQEQESHSRPGSRNGQTVTDIVPQVIPELSVQDIDRARCQEIMFKAVSAIFLLLLKWFKVSHILKFEYLSQLLVDSNYIQLTLKLFTHQELERVVSVKCERKELNFFQWCRTHSRQGKSDAQAELEIAASIPLPVEESPTELNRPQAQAQAQGHPATSHQLPSIDELGVPMMDIPNGSLTTFSWRAFFTTINTLRTLQKLIKAKPHRQLLMVQLKYSNTLRKALRIPQTDVRLYTLKIIKGQVPYCHRKWRQGNMRVITAIYLHCRPSLRDEWLAGCDIDQEVGEALPQERALRALTYWYNVRRYPGEMGMPREVDKSITFKDHVVDAEDAFLDEDETPLNGFSDYSESHNATTHPLDLEPDFFLQELEKMDLGVSAYASESEGLSPDQGEQFQEGGHVQGGEAPRWDPPLQMEGW